MLIKIGKVLGWILFALVVLVVVFYLVLLAINWRDQPPSATALEFQAFYENRTKIEDADNGYVYLMGFDVPKDESPKEWGVKRIAWTYEEKNTGAYNFLSIPGKSINLAKERSPQVNKLADTCIKPTIGCIQQLSINRSLFDEWYQAEQWLTERYRNLSDYLDWYESGYVDANTLLPGYSTVMNAQRLYLMHLWTLAVSGKAADVRPSLDRDLIFWRNVLEKTDSLITKMIAAAAIRNNLIWSNEILRRAPIDDSHSLESMAFNKSFDDAELSMYRCLVGEANFYKNHLSQENSEFRTISQFYNDDESILTRLGVIVVKPLFQRQDTLNKQSDILKNTLDHFAVPLDEYPNFFPRLVQAQSDGSDWISSHWPLYNIQGYLMLLPLNSFVYDSYFVRVSDVEGARRALLLITQMRSQSVPIEDAEAFINQSDLRNPYTNEAFAWDEEQSAVVFVGLTPNELGTYVFEY